MAPVKISLENHWKGDTWPGMVIGPVIINDEQPPVALASCKMQFRDGDDVLGHEFNSVPGQDIGTITIDDADTWEITVPEQLLNLDAGDIVSGLINTKYWHWDFETIDVNGKKLTLYYGKIKVKEDVTS